MHQDVPRNTHRRHHPKVIHCATLGLSGDVSRGPREHIKATPAHSLTIICEQYCVPSIRAAPRATTYAIELLPDQTQAKRHQARQRPVHKFRAWLKQPTYRHVIIIAIITHNAIRPNTTFLLHIETPPCIGEAHLAPTRMYQRPFLDRIDCIIVHQLARNVRELRPSLELIRTYSSHLMIYPMCDSVCHAIRWWQPHLLGAPALTLGSLFVVAKK